MKPQWFMSTMITGDCYRCDGYVAIFGGGYERLEDWLCEKCEKLKDEEGKSEDKLNKG